MTTEKAILLTNYFGSSLWIYIMDLLKKLKAIYCCQLPDTIPSNIFRKRFYKKNSCQESRRHIVKAIVHKARKHAQIEKTVFKNTENG